MNVPTDDRAAPPYEFRRNWADLSAIPAAASSWAHNGIAVTSAGELVGFHAGRLVAFDHRGDLLRTVETELTEGHGITLVQEDGEEFLWICDPGFVFEDERFNAFGSFHTSGANFAFADGSVKFLPDSTPLTILQQLGTRAGGEVIDTSGF